MDFSDSQGGPIAWATYFGLSVTSGLFGDEASGAPNLEELFGGGFELGMVQPHGAQKIGDILHLFWLWDKEKQEYPVCVPILIKTDYIGSDLIIQRLDVTRLGKASEFKINNHSTYAIRRPFDQPIMAFDDLCYERPDLNCRYLCNYYLCSNKGHTEIMTSHRGLESKKGHVAITREKDFLHVQFDKAYLDAEFSLLRKGLSRIAQWNS